MAIKTTLGVRPPLRPSAATKVVITLRVMKRRLAGQDGYFVIALLGLLACIFCIPSGATCDDQPGARTTLVANTSTWRYLHPTDGVDPAKKDPDFQTTFMQPDFDDTAWKSGADKPGPHGGFGYGEADFTGVDLGKPKNRDHRKTAYLRHRFATNDPMGRLVLKLQRDDAVIVYLDGKQVVRDNIVGPEAYDLGATRTTSGDDETFVETYQLAAELAPGKHLLAIALHNRSGGSSDLRVAEISLSGRAVVHISEEKKLLDEFAALGGRAVETKSPDGKTAQQTVVLDRRWRGGAARLDLLPRLARIKPLARLDLRSETINDSSLAALTGLTDLKWLRISRTQVTGGGLRKLAALEQLTLLSLEGPRIDDKALAPIARLPNLQTLHLRFTHIGDASLGQLSRLATLRHLDLSHSKVSGGGLRQIAKIEKLESLTLSHLNIEDADLAHLARLSSLKHLSLSGTKITAAGLMHLKGLKQFESLDLRLCEGVTSDDVEQLKAAMPALNEVRLKMRPND